MLKINTENIKETGCFPEEIKFGNRNKDVSLALGSEPESTDLNKRHPFDVAICRIPKGKANWPYHSHGAQWEFYHVISGKGKVRHEKGEDDVVAGDAFIFKPGEAHQVISSEEDDLVLYLVTDNPFNDTCHYPDSEKWLVRSPEFRIIRSKGLDYLDGEA